jgi:hypothetical protein
MQRDPWIFDYRSHCDEDSGSDSDSSFHGSKSNICDESRLRSELDISTRPDAAVFKPNPFSIAKMNAFTRSSRPVVAEPPQVAENFKNSGTIDAFFGKSVRKKPTTYQKPSTTGGCNFSANSQVISTTSRDAEKQPSKPPKSTMARYPNPCDRYKLNVIETLPTRGNQVDTDLACHNWDSQRVSSSSGMLHTPIRVCIEEESSLAISSPLSKTPGSIDPKAGYVPSPITCSSHRVVVPSVRQGKENRSAVPREGSYPLVSTRDKQKSGLKSSIPLAPIAHSRHTPMKRLVNCSKIDSMAHISTSTIKGSTKCYKGRSDEDESWSTLPPRKKFKPRFPLLLLMLIFDLRPVSCTEASNLC